MEKVKLVLFFLTLLFCIGEVSTATTNVYVDPPYISKTGKNVGDIISVLVKVTDVNDMAGFQFMLCWDPKVLDYDHDVNTNFADNIWSPGQYFTWDYQINTTGGYYSLAYSKKIAVSEFTGSSNLAQIFFKIKDPGLSYLYSSPLALSLTKMGDSSASPILLDVKSSKYGDNCTDISGPTSGKPDGVVNMRDINFMIQCFNSKPNLSNWSQCNIADVNYDNVVNMRDIQMTILQFNKRCMKNC